MSDTYALYHGVPNHEFLTYVILTIMVLACSVTGIVQQLISCHKHRLIFLLRSSTMHRSSGEKERRSSGAGSGVSKIVAGIISRRQSTTLLRKLSLHEHNIPSEHAELVARLASQGVQVISVTPHFPTIEV